MRRRVKLKASISAPIARVTVHDRQATALPRNAVVYVTTVEDPYDAAARITAVASIRDDPIGRLHSRGQIDD